MARIRTIKPGFFTHEGLADLAPLHRLLFIGLWTEADREGRLEDRPRRLKATLLPYDACNVDAMLNDLASTGFVRRYQVASMKYILIPSFLEHQRPHHKEEISSIPAPLAIDEPSIIVHAASMVQASTMDEPCETVLDAQEGKGREGNRKGMDLPAPQAATGPVWESYSRAYESRHGVRPPESAKARSQLKQFLTRVPRDDAPAIAGFYLTHNDALYVRAKHPTDLLLRDAQKIFAEWKTGRTTTGTEAHQRDRTQANANVFSKLLKETSSA